MDSLAETNQGMQANPRAPLSRHSGQHRVEFHGHEITANRRTFISSLVSGETIEMAMERAGIERSTAYSYLRDPTILDCLKKELESQILTRGAPRAWKRILSLIERESTPPGVALKASTWLLEAVGIGGQAKPPEGLPDDALDRLSIRDLERIAQEAKKRIDAIPATAGGVIEHRPQQQEPEFGPEPEPENLDDLMT